MLKKYMLLVLLPILTSCGASKGIEIRTVEVPIEVAVSCVEREDIPVEPNKVGNLLTGDAYEDLGIISISALELRAAFGEAKALLEACVIEENPSGLN
mgnify:CR=1 FL=1